MDYSKDKSYQRKNFQVKNQRRRNEDKDMNVLTLQQRSIDRAEMKFIRENKEKTLYAGPKFISSPPPSSLPKPPSHWIISSYVQEVCNYNTAVLTEQLRQILKITPSNQK